MDKGNNDNIIKEDHDDMTAVAVIDKEDITEYIDSDIQKTTYEIRGQQVMLDFDLAKLYNYDLSQFNRQVKRNIDRFPKDFMFQITDVEYKEILKCHFGISSTMVVVDFYHMHLLSKEYICCLLF